LKNHRIVAGAPQFEARGRRADQRHLGAIQRIADLVYLDGQLRGAGSMRQKGGADENCDQNEELKQRWANCCAFAG